MAAQLRVNESVETPEPKLSIDPPVPPGVYAYVLIVTDVLGVSSLPETVEVRIG